MRTDDERFEMLCCNVFGTDRVENDYLKREFRENLDAMSGFDRLETNGMTAFERSMLRSQYVMQEVEQERTQNKECEVYQQQQETKEAIMANKQTLTFVDFRNTKEVRIAGLSIKQFAKFQDGQFVGNTLSITLPDDRKLIIGGKNNRVWLGIDEGKTIAADVLEL